jgi:hypothetical protein
LGVLAFKNYQKIKPNKMILIDAIPMYLRTCRELFAKSNMIDNIWALPLCIVNNPETFENYFKIDLSNTISTSNILDQPAQITKEKIKVYMPTAPAVSPNRAADIIGKLITARTYIKIDIDTMDYDLVCSLISSGNKPAAINFECPLWTDQYITKLHYTLEVLKDNGYVIPDNIQEIISNSNMLDIFVSSESWAVMTYIIDNNYSTIYDKIYKNFQMI